MKRFNWSLAFAGLIAVAAGIAFLALTGCTAEQRANWVPFWKAFSPAAEGAAVATGQGWLAPLIHSVLKPLTEYPTASATLATVAAGVVKHLHSGLPGTERNKKHVAKKAKEKEVVQKLDLLEASKTTT